MRPSILSFLCTALVCSLLLAGCGDKKKKRKKASTEESATTEEAASTSTTAEAVKRPIPSVEGVPDYVNERVSTKNIAKAMRLNSQAVKLHTKKNYKRAVKKYLKALTLHPRYEYARYNLACAYALMGQNDKALGLLAQMKAVGTWKCLERVQKATKDTDFKSLYSNAEFLEITGDVVVEEPNYKKAAKQFKIGHQAFNDTFADNRSVRIVRTYVEDYDNEGEPIEKTQFYDVHNNGLLDRRMRKWFPVSNSREFTEEDWPGVKGWLVDQYEEGPEAGQWTCEKSCCSISGMCPGYVYAVDKICFWPVAQGKLLPIKIHFTDCTH